MKREAKVKNNKKINPEVWAPNIPSLNSERTLILTMGVIVCQIAENKNPTKTCDKIVLSKIIVSFFQIQN